MEGLANYLLKSAGLKQVGRMLEAAAKSPGTRERLAVRMDKMGEPLLNLGHPGGMLSHYRERVGDMYNQARRGVNNSYRVTDETKDLVRGHSGRNTVHIPEDQTTSFLPRGDELGNTSVRYRASRDGRVVRPKTPNREPVYTPPLTGSKGSQGSYYGPEW